MRLNSSKKFLESTTVQVLTITLCVFAIVALLLRLRLHQTMLSVITTSYASIDETRRANMVARLAATRCRELLRGFCLYG